MNKILIIGGSFIGGALVTCAVVAGLWYYRTRPVAPPPPQMVHSIRIDLQKYVDAQVEGSRVNVPKTPSLVGTPDYYLVVKLRHGESRQTPAYVDTPIGNGLQWPIDPPLRLDDIREVVLMDKNLMSDALVDRVLIAGRYEEGQYYNFHLNDDQPAPAQLTTPDTEPPATADTATNNDGGP